MPTKRGVCRSCEEDFSENMDVSFYGNANTYQQICKECRRLKKKAILPAWKRWEHISKARELPTYGEEHTRWSRDVNGFRYAFDDVPPVGLHQKRMSNKDAGKYYTDKINKAMGWKERVVFVPEPFVVHNVMDGVVKHDLEGHNTVDCQFGYHEAMRMAQQKGFIA